MDNEAQEYMKTWRLKWPWLSFDNYDMRTSGRFQYGRIYKNGCEWTPFVWMRWLGPRR